jgi:hypothetical protein
MALPEVESRKSFTAITELRQMQTDVQERRARGKITGA